MEKESREISLDDFLSVQMQVGTILSARSNEKAKKAAFILEIDFGEFGRKTSSAQLKENYSIEELIGKQVIAVLNFPPKNVAGIQSEVLVLGAMSEVYGTVLIAPDRNVENGTRIL